MLTNLSIRNLALVAELQWELSAGLVAVTGETGAGKSVIVGALKLILGERADKGIIRNGEEFCSVEAVFDVVDNQLISDILEESGLPACEEGQLIIRRVISAQSNRQFVNSSAATLTVLRKLGAFLVDLHGPHDHQSLFSGERQLAMLDSFAGVANDREKYQVAYRHWVSTRRAFQELRDAATVSEQEVELLRHQQEEISLADLQPSEEDEIQERYQRARNSTKLLDTAALAMRSLNGGEGGQAGLIDQLADLQRSVNELQRLDLGVAEFCAGLDSAVLELQELERSLNSYVEELEIDPAEAANLEARVDTFENLKRKYGPTLADVLEHLQRVEARLATTEGREDRLEELSQEVKQAEQVLRQVAKTLSAKRTRALQPLAKVVTRHLAELGFRQADFEIQSIKEEAPQPHGLERVEFLFCPNPGEPLKPLRQVASSGEISRVMLALKTALADQDATPLMVFDEIDANVGGEIARVVGEKMAKLGEQHQVIAITHFPQVAAVAHSHHVVAKEVVDGRTISTLCQVRDESRLEELVRMLGGGGEQARALAAELLKKNRSLK